MSYKQRDVPSELDWDRVHRREKKQYEDVIVPVIIRPVGLRSEKQVQGACNHIVPLPSRGARDMMRTQACTVRVRTQDFVRLRRVLLRYGFMLAYDVKFPFLEEQEQRSKRAERPKKSRGSRRLSSPNFGLAPAPCPQPKVSEKRVAAVA